jgi:DNA-binding winged helix-turn-helix (wHTH) protein
MTYFFGPFRLESRESTLYSGDVLLPLGPKVVLTLLALIERAGCTVTKDELLERVWPEGNAEESSLSQNIYLLRKALKDGYEHDPIATLPKRGYKFTAAVATDVAQEKARARRKPQIALGIGAAAIAIVLVAAYGYTTLAHRWSETAARDYALGRLLAEERTRAGVEQSIDAFRRVISEAPTSPLGYAGLADSYLMSTQWCIGKVQCAEDASNARAAAEKAVYFGRDAAETHATLAFVAMQLDHDPETAEREFERAIASNPKYPAAHLWYGWLLMNEHKYQEAAAHLEIAAALQPRSAFVLTTLAQDYRALHRVTDAALIEEQVRLIR